MDLPGVYALRPYSDEERVTRRYLLGGAADAVISIADATRPARSSYLTLQLLELGVPVVLALNVMDALRAGGGAVDTAELARALGIPVVPVSAALGEGSTPCWTQPRRRRTARRPTHGVRWHRGRCRPDDADARPVACPEARRGGPAGACGDAWLDDGGTRRAPPEAERQAVTRMERERAPRDGRCPRRALRGWTGWRGFHLPQALLRSRRSASTACSRGGILA